MAVPVAGGVVEVVVLVVLVVDDEDELDAPSLEDVELLAPASSELDEPELESAEPDPDAPASDELPVEGEFVVVEVVEVEDAELPATAATSAAANGSRVVLVGTLA